MPGVLWLNDRGQRIMVRVILDRSLYTRAFVYARFIGGSLLLGYVGCSFGYVAYNLLSFSLVNGRTSAGMLVSNSL